MLQTRIVLFSLLFVAVFGASQARAWKSNTTRIPSNDIEDDLESDYVDDDCDDTSEDYLRVWIIIVLIVGVLLPVVIFIVILTVLCIGRWRIRHRRLALLSCQNQSYETYPPAVIANTYQVSPQYAVKSPYNAINVPDQLPVTTEYNSQAKQQPLPAYY